MDNMQRVGISVEDGLLKKFDKLIDKQGYANRSEAIRDLIRDRLMREQLEEPASNAIAAIFVVYDHHSTQLTQKLTELQHSQFLKTISSMHIHIGHHDCLEVILLKGKVGEIKKMADRIIALKGVKLGKVNLIATE
ncbi:MAG: nickel-responsive transcriptional regulator NikR [Planctomycetes bacterium]|nr:nickel-responsive transcriptional regulator NikR [Planctomycetota bacterium]